jgi:transposase
LKVKVPVMRLFPPLASVWGNTIHGEHSRQEWSRERRACAPDHFDSYFRFAISEDVLPKRQIDELLAHSAEEGFVAQALREGLAAKRSNGGTKAALILQELNLHANSVADEHVQPLLTAMFKLGDEVDASADEAKAFSIGDNPLRIHWLLRRVTLERFDLARRSAIFMAAVETAALGWLVQFASSAYNDYRPRPGKSPAAEDQCLTTAADAEAVRSQALGTERRAGAGDAVPHRPRERRRTPRRPAQSVKSRHLKTDFGGLPIAFHLTGGEASDSRNFETLLDIGPDLIPRAALGDKGYDSKSNRDAARQRGICPAIPYRSNTKDMPAFFPKTLYKARARIEQAVGKLKHFKRIALRCEKTAQNYRSLSRLLSASS